MSIIDTHSHLYLEQFDEDREEMISRAVENGVERFYLPNIDSSTLSALWTLVDQHPDSCFAMMGLHPCSVKENYKQELELVENELAKDKYVAVGEIGLDLYWDKTTLNDQIDAFRTQVEWAKELGLPIVIHARDSFQEIFEVIDKLNDDKLFGIFHCFTGGRIEAEKIIAYGGFKMGIGGVVTFKNGGLDKTLIDVPIDHLVLETDAPYIAPAPNRGKRNEPAFLTYVVKKMAEIYSLSAEEVERITSMNALEVFEK